jgi:hypothetical protein
MTIAMTEKKENQLTNIISNSGVEQQTALILSSSFLPFFEAAKEWEGKAKAIIITDVSQKDEMKSAREMRLTLKDIRVNADKKRKELKEDSLRYGKAVQTVYNIIESTINPIEKYLEEQERFPEIQEEKRKDELRKQRSADISPYSEFVPFGIDLGVITEDDYQKLLAGAILQQKASIEAKKQRIEKEKNEAVEREKLRIENEKLRQEAIEKQKRLDAEKIAREKAEQELKDKNETEEKQRLERERIAEETKKNGKKVNDQISIQFFDLFFNTIKSELRKVFRDEIEVDYDVIDDEEEKKIKDIKMSLLEKMKAAGYIKESI